ncbi:hypothetical protein CDD82_4430 [Ophiocordyceps australis]|uniref:Rad21/Rec8-like protein N-terminal domain-containing protein n=1 Tax=Ophiocordyceps australis TaxID=1399860 RepID=A0A2C5Z6K2_9HYPO|nr:hypothetical protein CDD82_4430 [Ophiocordyceps australis]
MHKVLTSTQYGVATVWLAATMGKGSVSGKGALRRLTRKAIFDVDVPKACDTIIDPGAPLALRLQGKLLYGVSRVFDQQCTYILSDVEKTHSNMVSFFRLLHTQNIDQKSPKTGHNLITLADDPTLDIFNVVPEFNQVIRDKDLAGIPSQGSLDKFSQMTPRNDFSQGSRSSGSKCTRFPLHLQSPSLDAGSYRLPSEFGTQSSRSGKDQREAEIMPGFQPFVDDDLDPFHGIGLDFDADGNLVGILESEPELPPLPVEGHDEAQNLDNGPRLSANVAEQQQSEISAQLAPTAANAMIAAPCVSRRGAHIASSSSPTSTATTIEVRQVCTNLRRPGRPRKRHDILDEKTRISRHEYRAWTETYANSIKVDSQEASQTTPFEAKKNAFALIYGNGIAGVGRFSNAFVTKFHPLVNEFTGRTLKARLQGLHPSEIDFGIRDGRCRRRKSSEAFPDEELQREQSRRIRYSPKDDVELGRGQAPYEEEQIVAHGDEIAPDMGMNAPPPMEDRLSSSMMPWTRPPSAVRKPPGSTQKSIATSPSPLHARGSAIGSIGRRSDPRSTPIRPFSLAQGQASSSLNLESGLLLDQSLNMDTTTAAGLNGTRHHKDRLWVNFEHLANPGLHNKMVAAQAFFHVLVLATNGTIAVEQDDIAAFVPFGTIQIGVDDARAQSMVIEENL